MNPKDLPAINRELKRCYESHDAPIIELIQAQTNDPFKILVATLLSARTKDETTAAVTRKLFPRVGCLQELLAIPLEELEPLLHPVGFYRTKAKHLKALGEMLRDDFDGSIPQSIDELCTLPGVGRKTANLVVAVAFDKPGLCVDVHVHRISNRLGYVATKTPLETEMTLRAQLPKRYWKAWNRHLVSYGQTICRPTHPKWDLCRNRPECDRVGVVK
jgi:endonuclease III